MEPWRSAIHYHERTKHHPQRFARSLGYMDWDNQPNPFRRFSATELITLEHPSDAPRPLYDELYKPGAIPAQPVSAASVARLLSLSLAISAWKQLGKTRWALRINPSSGNLHPTEAYLVAGPVDGLTKTPCVFHYAPEVHALERRASLPTAAWETFTAGLRADWLLVGLSSIHWREAWKYGERAYRYCQHDAGHALAAVALSAAALGWSAHWLSVVSDAACAALLGLDRADEFEPKEGEHPEMLVAVIPGAARPDARSGTDWERRVSSLASQAQWFGKPNRLSREHVAWQAIDTVRTACQKPATSWPSQDDSSAVVSESLSAPPRQVAAATVVRQRRSAVAMDGESRMARDPFLILLDRLLPRFDRAPWAALGPPVCLHPVFFVHQVEDFESGLYILVRDARQGDALRAAMSAEFTWTQPASCPERMPFYQLARADCRRAAGQLACGQLIAAEGAFSVAMIARFEEPLATHGAWFYRRLHWEAGMIGQVLYLEAEAAGLRGTGIGCFFDDPTHEVLGLKDATYQTLYHFAVGGPVDDPRLTTLPAYSAAP